MIEKFTKEDVEALVAMSVKMSMAAKKLNEEIKAFNHTLRQAYYDVDNKRDEYEKVVEESQKLMAGLWDKVYSETKKPIERHGPLWTRTEEGQNLAYWADLLDHHYEVEDLEIRTPGTVPEMQFQEDLSHNMDVPTSLEELESRF